MDDIPLFELSKQEFDEQWLNRPLLVKGIFNHDQEMMVARTRHEERGFEIITPLYQRIDSKGGLVGLFVNRGRIPMEYETS